MDDASVPDRRAHELSDSCNEYYNQEHVGYL